MTMSEAMKECLQKQNETEDVWWVRPVGWKGHAVEIHSRLLWVVPRGNHDIPFHPTLGDVLKNWEVVSSDTVLSEN